MHQPRILAAQPPTRARVAAFWLAVEPRPGGVVIRLAGELDLDGAAELSACSGEMPLAGAVEIDLRHLRFLDTSGLAALVDLHDGLAARGCTVRLRGPQGVVLRLLDLAAAARWLPLPVDCPERPDWALAPQAAGG